MTTAALHVARTGLDAQSTRMQVIANNLANINTTGFKRDRANFETLSYQDIRAPGAQSSANTKYAIGLSLGTGVQLTGTSKVDSQGTLNQTSNAYDLAIQGAGYFQVTMPDGSTGYTRDGNFNLTAEGKIVTEEGYPLQPDITIPQGAATVTIGNDGTVTAQLQGQTAPTTLGQIQTASFINPAGLASAGNNIMKASASSGDPQVGNPGLDGRGNISQGSLEQSNVNVTEELVDMIETQRAYEVNSKMISATDDMLKYVNQQL